MSECTTLEPWWVDYLEGRLAAERTARLEAHVGACARCRAALDGDARIRGAYRELAREEPGASVVASVLAAARAEVEHRSASRPWRGPARWLAAAALVLAAGSLAWLLGARALSDTSDADELVREAERHWDEGRQELAIGRYRAALDLAPRAPAAAARLHRLAALHGERREHELALAALDDLVRSFPDYERREQALRERGDALAQLGRRDEAIGAYRLLVAEFPAARAALGQRIERLLVDDETRDALSALGYL